jgi:hypothetical protein
MSDVSEFATELKVVVERVRVLMGLVTTLTNVVKNNIDDDMETGRLTRKALMRFLEEYQNGEYLSKP